jgi:pre-mRNA-processing factor 40
MRFCEFLIEFALIFYQAMPPPQFGAPPGGRPPFPAPGGPQFPFPGPPQPPHIPSHMQQAPPFQQQPAQQMQQQQYHQPTVAAAPAAAAPPAASAPSHPDWQVFKSKDDKTYYFNKRTQQTTWDKPDELKTEEERAAVNKVSASDWQEFKTPEGKPYYFNSKVSDTLLVFVHDMMQFW